MTPFSGHVFQGLFRYEWLVRESQKLRLREANMNHEGRRELGERQRAAYDRGRVLARRAFGALVVADFLKTQFVTFEHVLAGPAGHRAAPSSPSGGATARGGLTPVGGSPKGRSLV
jgi:hypothetical protein